MRKYAKIIFRKAIKNFGKGEEGNCCFYRKTMVNWGREIILKEGEENIFSY